jgi:predicted phosphodiesterase
MKKTCANSWKRGLVVSCSHAQMMLPDALPTLQRFAKDWKPDHLIHLGDFLDTTALRSGSAGTADEGADIQFDLDAGLDFLNAFYGLSCASMRVLCLGNHDARPYKLLNHPKAIVRHTAKAVCDAIDYAARKNKAEVIPYDIKRGWKMVSTDCAVGHGFMFSENAVRDHAEMLGCNVIMGHLHRCEVRKGRTVQGGVGYCVGWLGNEDAAGYARERRATLAWENAFATYETNGKETIVQMYKRTKEGWRI